MTKLLFLFLLCFSFSAKAVVLDWSGSYSAEMVYLYGSDDWQTETVHNLRLKPDILVFDGLRLRSWFQLNEQASASQLKFYPQSGPSLFRSDSDGFSPVFLEVRDVYIEWSHAFGLLQFGWKPHHFGMGMYYSESSDHFDSVYNAEGSRGMLSWKALIGSYYVQPIIHYSGDLFFNVFIQGGWVKEQYGVEGIYKKASVGVVSDETHTPEEDYLGLYAYFKKNSLSLEMEAGYLMGNEESAGDQYASVLSAEWQSPWKKLALGLDLAWNSSSGDKAFYLDPNFSSGLSLTVALYESFKDPAPEYFKEYTAYAFHSSLFISPSVRVSLAKSTELKGMFLAQLPYPEMSAPAYGAELILKHKLNKGWEWNTGAGLLFPSEDSFQIGAFTQAAITF